MLAFQPDTLTILNISLLSERYAQSQWLFLIHLFLFCFVFWSSLYRSWSGRRCLQFALVCSTYLIWNLFIYWILRTDTKLFSTCSLLRLVHFLPPASMTTPTTAWPRPMAGALARKFEFLFLCEISCKFLRCSCMLRSEINLQLHHHLGSDFSVVLPHPCGSSCSWRS